MTAEAPKIAKRGRPVGSSRLNAKDAALLARVARAIVQEPSLKLTTALRRLGIDTYERPSDVRRLQRKWKEDKSSYLKAAEDQIRKENETFNASDGFARAIQISEQLQEIQKNTEQFMRPMRAIEAQCKAIMPASRAIVRLSKIYDAPHIRMLRDMKKLGYR